MTFLELAEKVLRSAQRPMTTKDNLDWETLNKLAVKNHDFKQFIIRVRNDLNSSEIRKEQYDKVLGKEQLVRSVQG